ncbi:MAG: TIM-barrel domain-containing protein [Puniceicoccaceae bacterium]
MKQLIALLVLLTFGLASADSNLSPIDQWQQLANGVWKAELFEADDELSYTDLAARKPRLETLNGLTNVSFPFAKDGIGFCKTKDGQIYVRVPVEADESIYGFGLQFDGIKKSKKVLNLSTDHWKLGGGRTHAPVPFYISSRGYGVLFNTSRFLKVYVQTANRVDSPNLPVPVDRNPPPEEPAVRKWNSMAGGDSVEVSMRGQGLEVIVFSGDSLQDVVARYNLYCGGGTLPPLWGLGFWHRVPADFTADETNEEASDFSERSIPLDVIGLEPGWMTRSYPCTYEWQKHRFPDPKGFAQGLLDQGIRLNLWENPYISPEGKLYEPMLPYAGSHLVWLGIVPDYTIPEARKILTDQHKEDHLDIGVSGYKIDEVDGYDRWLWPEHAEFPSGTAAETMRQSYGLMLQQMLYKDLFHSANVRTYGNVRSSNAGASGYPFVLYSDSYKHAEYITGISAASLSGILWSPEVRSARSPEEWRARIQTVCFSHMAKLNAWASGTKPWQFDEVTDDIREVIRLRMRLLPYLYTAFANYNRFGIPPIRAMILEQGSQKAASKASSGTLHDVDNPYAETRALEQDDQFMFGPSILVAPYYESQTSKREVRLPKGNWYDFYTGQFAGNGETITVNDPARIPLFVKEGAVIPMLSKHVDNTRSAYGHPLEVRHYGSEPGTFELYEDDGLSFDYETGKFSLRQLGFADGKGTEKTTQPGPKLFGPVQTWVQMTR